MPGRIGPARQEPNQGFRIWYVPCAPPLPANVRLVSSMHQPEIRDTKRLAKLCEELQATWYEKIPITNAIGARIVSFDGIGLSVEADFRRQHKPAWDRIRRQPLRSQCAVWLVHGPPATHLGRFAGINRACRREHSLCGAGARIHRRHLHMERSGRSHQGAKGWKEKRSD